MVNILKVCGHNIRRYRKSKGLTLDQVSSVGITGAYLGYLERGQRNPSLLTLAKVGEFLEISPYFLLRVPEDDFEKEFQELADMLCTNKEIKHVMFLKEVLRAYLHIYV